MTVNKRFYDQDGLLRESIQLTGQLPQDIQGLVATGFNWLAIHHYQADARLGNLKSLGADKILPLYKSKNKRRDYDSVPEFHTAVNYLHVLEPTERRGIAECMAPLSRFVLDYMEKCTFTALLPDHKKLQSLRDTYLPMEKARAAIFLQEMRQELLSKPPVSQGTLDRASHVVGGSSIHLGEF